MFRECGFSRGAIALLGSPSAADAAHDFDARRFNLQAHTRRTVPSSPTNQPPCPEAGPVLDALSRVGKILDFKSQGGPTGVPRETICPCFENDDPWEGGAIALLGDPSAANAAHDLIARPCNLQARAHRTVPSPPTVLLFSGRVSFYGRASPRPK